MAEQGIVTVRYCLGVPFRMGGVKQFYAEAVKRNRTAADPGCGKA